MFFFDTYALVEVAKGNPAYKTYGDFTFIVTHLNIGEFYIYLLRTNGKAEAEKKLASIAFTTIPLSTEVMKEAAEFKQVHNSKELSWADCVGYMTARQLGLKFLTGDSGFKDTPHVEFVK